MVLFIIVGCSRNIVGDIRLSDQYELVDGNENCPTQINLKYSMGLGYEITFVYKNGYQDGPFQMGGQESDDIFIIIGSDQRYFFTYDNDFIGRNELELWSERDRNAKCQYKSD